MLVRSSLYFRSEILLGDFLPDEEHADLHLCFMAEGVPMKLFLSTEDKSRMGSAWHQHTQQAIKQNHLVIRVFTLEMTVECSDPNVLEKLRSRRNTPETIELKKRLASLSHQVHDRLGMIFAAVYKSGDITSAALYTEGDDYLKNSDCRWLDGAEWRPVVPADGFYVAGLLYPIEPVGRACWLSEMADLLSSGEVPLWHRLLAESVQHLSHNRLRIAVIESVTALEAMFGSLVPQVLAKTSKFSGMGSEWITSNLTAGQLQPTAKRCLPLLQQEGLVTQQQVSTILAGIKRRNALIHDDPSKEPVRTEVQQLVTCLGDFAAALEKVLGVTINARLLPKNLGRFVYTRDPAKRGAS